MFLQKIKQFKYYKPFYFWGITCIFSLFFTGIILFLALYFMVFFGFFGKVPDKQALKDIENYEASEVYTADGKIMGKYYIQERTNITYEELPKHLINALIATEDARFYEHEGIDYKSFLRVLFKSLLLADESSGGGSTITQQLAKNLYGRDGYGSLSLPVNKLKEMFIAKRLESVYSKKEIITYYLNTIPFGSNTYGVETASERFFGKPTSQLKPEESAVLIGMLKATNYYNPKLYPEHSKKRRNVVLSQMEKYEYLKPAKEDSLQQLPLDINYNKINHNKGIAPYLRQKIRLRIKNWLNDYNKENDTNYNLYKDGLKIYTSINARLQQYAKESVEEHMKKLQNTFNKHWKGKGLWKKNQDLLLKAVKNCSSYKNYRKKGLTHDSIMKKLRKERQMMVFTWNGEEKRKMSVIDSLKHYLSFLQSGFVAIDPQNGWVKAWVGGIDHEYFQYDHVTAKRQVGSIFKPIVYATAIKHGTKPCEFFPNKKVTYEKYDNWQPRNASNEYGGYFSVKGALTHSVNVVSVQLLQETGIEKTIDLAHSMGIREKIPEVPSIALGSPEIPLYEMVNAYSTFANKGMSNSPLYITYVENSKGELLKDFTGKKNQNRVLSQKNNTIMLEMLQSVIDSGTARSIRSRYGLNNDIAGKTGTTQSHSDGWFIGCTPDLVAGVWVGADNPQIHFRSLRLGQGANTALPIWARFMQKISQDKQFNNISNASFSNPDNSVSNMLDCPLYREKEEKSFWHKLFGHSKNGDHNQISNDNQEKEKKNKKKGLIDKIKGLFKK